MRYTLKQLQVFLAVAKHRNVSIAASELALSQSAASTSLKELESRFDVDLFDRIGKRLQLNERGSLLKPKAEALMDQAEGIERALMGAEQVGRIKVGATLSIGNYLAVEIIAAFIDTHPEAEVSLQVANTETIAARVQDFSLDIGLIEGELQAPDLEIQHWRDDELAVFCPPGHPLANKAKLSDAELMAADWIVREKGSGTRQAFERAMSGILSALHLRLELQHTEGIKRAVEAGLGIGCLSKITLQDAFQRGKLLPLAVPHRDWTRKLYFVLHRQKYVSDGVRSWMDHCRRLSAGSWASKQ